MSYLIAAYAITAVILLAYGIQLAREKSRLTREKSALARGR